MDQKKIEILLEIKEQYERRLKQIAENFRKTGDMVEAIQKRQDALDEKRVALKVARIQKVTKADKARVDAALVEINREVRGQEVAAERTKRMWERTWRSARKSAEAEWDQIVKGIVKREEALKTVSKDASAAMKRDWTNNFRDTMNDMERRLNDFRSRASQRGRGMGGAVGRQLGFGGMGQDAKTFSASFFGSMLGNALPGMIGGGFRALGHAAHEVESLVTEFTALGIEANTFKESTLVSLSALRKSHDEAERLFTLYESIDVMTPFSLDEVARAGRMLESFGLNSEIYLERVAKAGSGARMSMEQLTRLLERAHAGIFDRRSYGAAGITQMQLESAGISFEASGKRVAGKHRGTLDMLHAVLKVLEDRWGQVFMKATGTAEVLFTTLLSNIKRIARAVTGELFEAWKGVLKTINDVAATVLGTQDNSIGSRILGSIGWVFGVGTDKLTRDQSERGKQILAAIQAPFNLAARALESFNVQADKVTEWLAEFLDRDEIENFLINLTALFTTLGETILNLFGVDFSKIFDAANAKDKAKAFFDAILEGIKGIINWVFKVVSDIEIFWLSVKFAFTDFKNFISDTFEDVRDTVDDITTHIGRTWDVMLSLMSARVARTGAEIVNAFGSIMLAIGNTPFGRFYNLGKVGQDILKAGADLTRSADYNEGRAKSVQGMVWEDREKARNRELEKEKNRRSRDQEANMGFEADVAAARGRSQDFWADYNRRRNDWHNRFGGQNAMPPPHDFGARQSGMPGQAGQMSWTPQTGWRSFEGAAPPGTLGAAMKAWEDFLGDVETVQTWTKIAEEAHEGGRLSLDEYLKAQDVLVEALKRQAEVTEDGTLKSAQAWGEYGDALNNLKKTIREAHDKAFNYLQKRTSNIESFYDLLPEHEADRAKRAVLPDYLSRQRSMLVAGIGGESDPTRRAEMLGELIGVAGQYKDLFAEKGGFLSQFSRGGKSDAMSFLLGKGNEAMMLRDLILNGDPNAERLLDPAERTADNTARIAEMMQAAWARGGPMVNGQPRPDLGFTGPAVGDGSGNWQPVTININGGDPQEVRQVVLDTLKEAYRRSQGNSPARRY